MVPTSRLRAQGGRVNQPTTDILLEQLRATHVGHRSSADVNVAVEAGARALAGRWEELPHERQATLIAILSPVVEAALAALDQRPQPPAPQVS